MDTHRLTTARQETAGAGELLPERHADHMPDTVAVVVNADKLAVALSAVLALEAEALAKSLASGEPGQEPHRRLLTRACDSLREEIDAITGAEVREAAAEVEALTGIVVPAHTRAALAQMFGLFRSVSATAALAPRPGNGIWNA